MGINKRVKRRISVIALAVAAALTLAFTGYVLMRDPVPAPASAIKSTGKPIALPFVPQVLVVGDTFTGGTNEGGLADKGWPALVQSSYTARGARLQMNLAVRAGGGYVAKGQFGETLGQGASEAAFEAQDVVVVFGGLSDRAREAEVVGAAASALYADLKKASPKAKLIVVGPAWPYEGMESNMLAVRDAIHVAAANAGATFVDPIADGWFAGSASKYISGDKTNPTDEGHKYMATKLNKPVLDAVRKVVPSK